MRTALVRALLVTLLSLAIFPRAAHAADRDDVDLDSEEHAIVESINHYRTSLGLEPLTAVPLLNAVAFAHSVDMARRGYFGHIDPDGRSPFDRMARVGYDVDNEGENLAAGRTSGAGAFAQWRRSPSHDAAMRDPTYRAIGIGRVIVPGSRYGTYWTAVFGDEVRAIDFDVSNVAPITFAPTESDSERAASLRTPRRSPRASRAAADDRGGRGSALHAGPHASRASQTRPSAARVQRARRIAATNRAHRYAPIARVTSARHRAVFLGRNAVSRMCTSTTTLARRNASTAVSHLQRRSDRVRASRKRTSKSDR